MKKGNKTKFTKGDMTRIGQAYYKKLDEYSKLTLEQLKELLPTLGGTYRYVCDNMIKQKEMEIRLEKFKESESNQTIENEVLTNETKTNE